MESFHAAQSFEFKAKTAVSECFSSFFLGLNLGRKSSYLPKTDILDPSAGEKVAESDFRLPSGTDPVASLLCVLVLGLSFVGVSVANFSCNSPTAWAYNPEPLCPVEISLLAGCLNLLFCCYYFNPTSTASRVSRVCEEHDSAFHES